MFYFSILIFNFKFYCIIIIIVKAICNAQDPPKKAAKALYVYILIFLTDRDMCTLNYLLSYINNSLNNQNNTLFIDVSTSHRKSSSGLTSGGGRQYAVSFKLRAFHTLYYRSTYLLTS